MPRHSGPHIHFVGQQKNVDTVVFVHGIFLGHYKKTWKRFHALLPGDLDLPKLDLMFWGYDTGLFRGRSIDLNGERLTTELRVRVDRPENLIVLVGHSLGGLVILKSLCVQMGRNLAQDLPCAQINRVVTCLTPLNGHWVSRIARSSFLFKRIFNQQARDLCKETFCKDLVSEVRQRIYEPPTNGPSARRIPIRLNIGNRDKTVTALDRKAASAMFSNPPPNEYDGTHTSIKDPRTRFDQSYLVLKQDLEPMISETFRRLSRSFHTATTQFERDAAWWEIKERYGRVAKSRIRAYLRKAGQNRLVNEALELATFDVMRRDLPAFIHIDHAARAIAIGGSR